MCSSASSLLQYESNVKKLDRPFVFYSDTLSILANIGARYVVC